MPDISTINGTDITLLSNFQGVALTSGSLINGQTASLVNSTYDEIYSVDLASLGANSLALTTPSAYVTSPILTTDYKTYEIFISEITNEVRIYNSLGGYISAGYVFWYDTHSTFYNGSITASTLPLQVTYINSDWGKTSARITLYDPAATGNPSRFDAEVHQASPSSSTSFFKIISGQLKSTSGSVGISFSSQSGNFTSGRLVVYGIA